MKKGNTSLLKTRVRWENEFYTTYEVIEEELQYYSAALAGQVVYCNCDDYRFSQFFVYFRKHFARLGLKEVLFSCVSETETSQRPYYTLYSLRGSGQDVVKELQGSGSYISDECLAVLRVCDVVVTNPPFSLFVEFLETLLLLEKKFLVLGNINAVVRPKLFPFLKEGQFWIGVNDRTGKEYLVPAEYEIRTKDFRVDSDGKRYISIGPSRWFTNLPSSKPNPFLELSARYDAARYDVFDNFDGININKTKEIPMDYDGVMGVPVTFLDKFNKEQFCIVGCQKGADGELLRVGGVALYSRILIHRLKIKYSFFEKKVKKDLLFLFIWVIFVI